jgi:formyl-CoA transferase
MGMYATGDGYLNLAAPWGRLWKNFCGAIGRPDLTKDSRFARADDRSRNRDALTKEIETALRERTTAEWVEILNAADVPAGPVNDIAQTFADPQVRHLGVAAKVTHPQLGEIEVVRNATNLEGVSGAIRRPAPEAGEHTDEILLRFGLDAQEIEALRADEVI